jgi:hypothetical protein
MGKTRERFANPVSVWPETPKSHFRSLQKRRWRCRELVTELIVQPSDPLWEDQSPHCYTIIYCSVEGQHFSLLWVNRETVNLLLGIYAATLSKITSTPLTCVDIHLLNLSSSNSAKTPFFSHAMHPSFAHSLTLPLLLTSISTFLNPGNLITGKTSCRGFDLQPSPPTICLHIHVTRRMFCIVPCWSRVNLFSHELNASWDLKRKTFRRKGSRRVSSCS